MKSFDEIIRQRRILLITWHMFEAMIKRARLTKNKEKNRNCTYQRFYFVFHLSANAGGHLHDEVISKISASLLTADHPGATGAALSESEMNYLNIVFEHCTYDAKYDDAGDQNKIYGDGSFEDGISHLLGLQQKVAQQMAQIDHWIDGEGSLFMR